MFPFTDMTEFVLLGRYTRSSHLPLHFSSMLLTLNTLKDFSSLNEYTFLACSCLVASVPRGATGLHYPPSHMIFLLDCEYFEGKGRHCAFSTVSCTWSVSQSIRQFSLRCSAIGCAKWWCKHSIGHPEALHEWTLGKCFVCLLGVIWDAHGRVPWFKVWLC